MKIFVQESCKKCGGSSWLKAGMIAERSGPKLGAETLSIRGAEEKWIGGATAANINLQQIIFQFGSMCVEFKLGPVGIVFAYVINFASKSCYHRFTQINNKQTNDKTINKLDNGRLWNLPVVIQQFSQQQCDTRPAVICC